MLSTDHRAELEFMSAIDPGIVAARGYQTIENSADLPAAFAEYQRRPGLLIPLRSVRGDIESWQLKPNDPRPGKNGKIIKYETAANAQQLIDVPESVRPLLGDPGSLLVITEGAKKVDSALSHGIPCVIGLQGVFGWRGTNSHGGKTALPDWEDIALNGREVLLAFDSDVMTKDTVRVALDRLSGFLSRKGATVYYLVMPDLPQGGKCGLDDWFALGKTVDAMEPIILEHLPPAHVTSSMQSTTAQTPSVTIGAAVPRLRMRSLAEVVEKRIDWLWPGWLPKGMLSVLGGYAGDGKSTFTLALAAAFSAGTLLPDGTPAPMTNTLLVLAEDDVSHVVKGRLAVHGANHDRIVALDDVLNPDGGTRGFNLRTDVPLLRQAVLEHQIGLIVLDPLSSVLSSSDRNSEGEVRDALNPLVQMAEETGVAVIGIMHVGKNDGQVKAFQKLMGSTAFTALARSVWMVHDLPEEFQHDGEPKRKMIGVVKSNYAVPPQPIQFHRPLDEAIVFGGVSPIGIDEAIRWRASKPESEHRSTESGKAEEWLLAFMDGTSVSATAVRDAAEAEGFSRSTLQRAKAKLGIRARRENETWHWILPQEEAA